MNKFVVCVIGFSFFIMGCQNTTTKMEKENKESVVDPSVKVDSIVEGSVVDSFVLVYNSLPSIKLDDSFFMKGVLSKYNGEYYPIYFKDLADLGAPDSIQDAHVDTTDKTLNIGLGDYSLNLSFFKDSASKFIFVVIRTNQINQLYGEDSDLIILKGDSLLNWVEVTDLVIDKKEIFSKYTSQFNSRVKFNELFHIDIDDSGRGILLKINIGKRKLECNEKVGLICNLKEDELKDSIKIEWNSSLSRFKIK